MIVHGPEMRQIDDRLRVSARLEASHDLGEHDLWFEVGAGDAELVTHGNGDSFAAALGLTALALGEDLEVRATVSPQLLHGIEERGRIFRQWCPASFAKPVSVRCDEVREPAASPRRTAGAAFSGGVDSFYTLWAHTAPREDCPTFQISYALFVHGFDIPLENETFETICRAYAPALKGLGVRLVPLRTNFRRVVSGCSADWGCHIHGDALCAAAILLGNAYSRFFVPSSKSYTTLAPWGSDPMIDHLLSTEALAIVHDGAHATRVDKLATLAEWPATYDLLRTCSRRPDGLRNCCRCDNCVRTMIMLAGIGALDRYRATFPLPLTRRLVRRSQQFTSHERLCARQVISLALGTGRRGFAGDLRYALVRSYALCMLARLLRPVRPWFGRVRFFWRLDRILPRA